MRYVRSRASSSHAAFNMSSSSLPTVSTPHGSRPNSIRSVASNSSISSGVSLTRRSRTRRTRSKTVTGSAVTRPEAQSPSPQPDYPLTDTHSIHKAESSPQISDTLLLPPRSLNVATSSRSLTSQEADSAAGEVTLVAALPQPSPMPSKLVSPPFCCSYEILQNTLSDGYFVSQRRRSMPLISLP